MANCVLLVAIVISAGQSAAYARREHDVVLLLPTVVVYGWLLLYWVNALGKRIWGPKPVGKESDNLTDYPLP